MAIKHVLRTFDAFINGAHAGGVEDVELPKLTLKTEEFRGGGMDVPVEIDLGMEKMEASVTFQDYDPDLFRLFGLADGTAVNLVLKAATTGEDGATTGVTATLRGQVKELDPGTWKLGDKATLKIAMACRYYKYEMAGETLIEIDPENMVRIVNGTDQLAAQREALGR